jgi:hypothetical protein
MSGVCALLLASLKRQSGACTRKARLQVYEQIAASCYQLRLEPTPQRGSELLGKFSTT